VGLAFTSGAAAARPDDFDALVSQLESNPDETATAQAEKESSEVEFGLRNDEAHTRAFRAFAPRLEPSLKKISPAAIRLIVACEVSGARAYERLYQKPVWPGARSGVTIGVGYDLGFIKPEWLHEDWDGIAGVDARAIAALVKACRLRGDDAKAFCQRARDVVVPWSAAQLQFQSKLLPRYTAETILALPAADRLPDDCLGALVSLVYNRGPSFHASGPRYREMRNIYSALKSNNLPAIPVALESMTRLWPKLPGLVTRRRAEAALFRRGMGVKT
jgi:GH24 family phage-related lysozyme (muramidase)